MSQDELSPLVEPLLRAYLETRDLKKAAEACFLAYRQAKALFAKPEVKRRLAEMVEEHLRRRGMTKAEALEKLRRWVEDGVPHERVRAMELLAKLADWFPAQKHVTHHVAVAAGGATYEQLVATLEAYGTQFEPEQLRMIRARLEQDARHIARAMELIDELETLRVAEGAGPGQLPPPSHPPGH
ncbi:MAG: hypothetical protein QN144_14680 [Armatimonadota bacterium]|nr:hypothetical protein [Armatimonadota bacterium]